MVLQGGNKPGPRPLMGNPKGWYISNGGKFPEKVFKGENGSHANLG